MKPYQRGDVVFIDVPVPTSGHVQGGRRPWVIVQNNVGNQHSPTTIVVPLTTVFKRMDIPTHAAVIENNLRPSVAHCEQVRVIDISDSWEYVCTLSPINMTHIDKALSNTFFFEGRA